MVNFNAPSLPEAFTIHVPFADKGPENCKCSCCALITCPSDDLTIPTVGLLMTFRVYLEWLQGAPIPDAGTDARKGWDRTQRSMDLQITIMSTRVAALARVAEKSAEEDIDRRIARYYQQRVSMACTEIRALAEALMTS